MKKIVLTLFFLALPALAAEPAPLAYPHGYRQWTHVKSMQIKSGHPLYHSFGGIHHVYANKKAMEGFKSGKFPNGATFVMDLMQVQEDGFSMSEGPRKLLAVMHKDRVKYAETAGWAFEAFRGDSRKERMVGTAKNAAAECLRCHAAQQKNDYVFSGFRK